MIDYWQLTKDFAPGDCVQQVILGQGIAPYVGRVTAVMRGIGFVDVQWPFGNERVSPEDLVKVDPKILGILPPTLNFGYYPGLDTKSASSSPWRITEVPAGFHRELSKVYHKGVSEVRAYDELWHRYASFSDDTSIRDEVGKFYRFAFNTFTMYLSGVADKTATYWVSQNRQHRATKAEVDIRKPNCPRCGTAMRKATYKMDKGARGRLFACPKDLYLIKQTDILSPDGLPVEW